MNTAYIKKEKEEENDHDDEIETKKKKSRAKSYFSSLIWLPNFCFIHVIATFVSHSLVKSNELFKAKFEGKNYESEKKSFGNIFRCDSIASYFFSSQMKTNKKQCAYQTVCMCACKCVCQIRHEKSYAISYNRIV